MHEALVTAFEQRGRFIFMKTAGELLSAFFDENMVKKAQGYTDLYRSWTRITDACGVASAGAHSRIFELERAVLLVETDHPGWIQILQTRQKQLLAAVQAGFPALHILNISFFYSKDPASFSQGKTAGEGRGDP